LPSESPVIWTNRIRAGEGLPVSMEECLLPEVVENSISVLSEIYGPRFVVERSPKPIKGFWDSGAIQRCIENLAANAIKYGKPRAIVTIGTEATKNKVVISVHNEGNPISKEDQASLFGDYRRTESAVQSGQKGWGIGLTLVKGFMEAHFGKVRVKSDAQSGTTFSIELPIDARKEQRV
jgi:signal transduction histidine kinase